MEKKGDVIFVHDGARYHTSKASIKYLADVCMQVLDWPSQSPDLNLIENLWRVMKVRISARRHHIKTESEMRAALQEEWDRLKPNLLYKLVASMPNRIKEVIAAKGGATSY
jgi:transposase